VWGAGPQHDAHRWRQAQFPGGRRASEAEDAHSLLGHVLINESWVTTYKETYCTAKSAASLNII